LIRAWNMIKLSPTMKKEEEQIEQKQKEKQQMNE
jgi:hypothetical protein